MATGRVKLQALRAHLDRHLFPRPLPTSSGLGRWEYLLLAFSLTALGVVLQLARLGFSGSLESFWAEDGPIFFQEALAQSLGEALTSPYSNYLVVVPRLIGEAATLVPLGDAPAAVSILSATLVAISGLVVWHASAAHVESPYLRGALAALTVLAPVAGLESIDSASYASWYMLFAVFWILLWRPATTKAAVLASLFVLIAALSNPILCFFLPLAALRALAARDRRDLAIVGSFALGVAIQVPVVVGGDEPAVTPSWTHDIWTAYLQRVVDGAPLGLDLGGTAWSHLGWPLLVALVLLGAAGLAAGLRGSRPGPRYLTAIAVPTSLAMFVVSLYQRAVGGEMVWPEGIYYGNAGRYAIVPALLLISVAVVLIDDFRRRRPGSWRRSHLVPAATAGVLLISIATSFDAGDRAVRGTPQWRAALREAATACASERVEIASIPTSPPGFVVSLPCERVSSFADAEPAAGAP